MSKQLSTRGYIGAWIVVVVAVAVFVVSSGTVRSGSTATASYGALATAAWITGFVASLVMLVTWVGALVRLGQLRAWPWLAGVLISHLLFLGIFGMVAYAMAGPEDDLEFIAETESRPTLA